MVLRPLLERYALAKPNARSSHTIPTPQGGGIAVVAATIVTVYGALYFWSGTTVASEALLLVLAAVILIAGVGAADDIRSIAVAPRLLLQALAVTLVIYTLPNELRVVPFVPWWAERVLLVVGGLWFVNLVNFMDGLDWMTVAEVVPITAALAVVGWLGALPPPGMIVTLALCGAMIGFAYFNRPVARLFLGDVGSLPIGLLLGWLLLLLATSGHLAAAIVLPLYYLADATITLLRRLARGEPVWQAHRTHFYQLATDRGFTVIAGCRPGFRRQRRTRRAGDLDGDRARQAQRRRGAVRRRDPRGSAFFLRLRAAGISQEIRSSYAAAPWKSGTASRNAR